MNGSGRGACTKLCGEGSIGSTAGAGRVSYFPPFLKRKMAEKKANDAGNYSMAMSLRSRRADLQRVQETYFKLQASDTCYVVYALLLCRKLE